MSRRKQQDGKQRGFLSQLVIVVLVMGGMFAGLLQAADHGARAVPFTWEKAFADLARSVFPLPFTIGEDPVSKAWAKDLQTLVDNLAREMEIDEEIEIQVDYSPDQIINAVAIMGGQVIVFDGLINLAKSENALAFVLAHEIAHLKHRHGIRSMGRQLLVSSGILIVLGTSGNVSEVAQMTSVLSSLKYSRDMETAADEEAIAALAKHYGHVNGMTQIFSDLRKLQGIDHNPPEIIGSHPEFDGRISHMVDVARANGWDTEGTLTPLGISMSMVEDDLSTCTKSITLCRIEESIERIREGQDSFVDPDPAALDDALVEAE